MTVHDHFDGSANCVECHGPCRLSGEACELTRLLRWILEYFTYSHKGWLPPSMEETLAKLLGPERLKTLRARCVKSLARIYKQAEK